MTTTLTEADVEQAAFGWLTDLYWAVVNGQYTAPDTPNTERVDFGQVVLDYRLRDAIVAHYPTLPHRH